MKETRVFWVFATVAFVLVWFVFIPYLASNPRVVLTAPTVKSWMP